MGESWFFSSIGHNFSQNGLIFARSSLDCQIFSALSVDTHIGYPKSHKATALIQPYSQIMAIKLYSHMALWLFEKPIWIFTERVLTRLNYFNVTALILSWFCCWTKLVLSWFYCWSNSFCWYNLILLLVKFWLKLELFLLENNYFIFSVKQIWGGNFVG